MSGNFVRHGSFNRAALIKALLLTLLFIPTVVTAQSALQFIPIAPCRVVDTRYGIGPLGGPALKAGATRTFNIQQGRCNIPATAMAYSLNATVVPTARLGWITMWPAGATMPFVSTLNSYDGRVKANAAITAAGTGGAISVYATDVTQLILDINGYFVPLATSTSELQYYTVSPCRVADTRSSGGTISAGTSRSFPVLSSPCGVPSTAVAYSMNVTALPRTTLSYLTTWATGQSQPNVSTLNAPTGKVTANAAIVSAGTGGDISVFVSNDSDVILDVNGYFAPPSTSGLSYYPLTQCRSLDTRYGINKRGPFQGMLMIPMRYDAVCATPAAVQAYVLNATVLPVNTLSYLTLWPDGASQPNVSTLNAYDGAITSNMAIVPNVYGVLDAYAPSSTQLVFDLSGYFAP